MPEISIATVYNCLDALVKCGLARQVSVERGATRYCSNMEQHNHFHCEKCGATYDVDRGAVIEPALRLPAGFRVNRCEISLRGVCPACSAGDQEAR